MPERLNGPHSKCGRLARVSGVRLPLSPKIKFSKICQRKSTFKEYQKFVKTIAKKFENSNGEIIGENMSKLKKRYPKEFTTERAKRKMVD